MASVVSICNLALSNLGVATINALSEATQQARSCNQHYAQARDAMLQSYPWRFAEKTEAMGEVVNDRPSQWGFAYQRPADCLKIRWIGYSDLPNSAYPLDDATQMAHPYSLEGQTIYCSVETAVLRYTCQVTDPTKFPPIFVDALAASLAVRMAIQLTGDPKVRADNYQLMRNLISQAEVADANEVRQSSDIASETIAARSYG